MINAMKAYFGGYRDHLMQSNRYRNVMFAPIIDETKLGSKCSATYVRKVIPKNSQTDDYNCGCFVLHTIECVVNEVPEWTSFPSSADYMGKYRRRILLSLCENPK